MLVISNYNKEDIFPHLIKNFYFNHTCSITACKCLLSQTYFRELLYEVKIK